MADACTPAYFEDAPLQMPATVGSSPYVLYPAQSAQGNPAWSAYKRIQHALWTWEDFDACLDRGELRAAIHRAIVTAAFVVVDSQLQYLSTYPITRTLSGMCAAEKTAAERSLYGVVIARSYLHLEVYSGLALALQHVFEDSSQLDAEESSPFVQIGGAQKIHSLELQLTDPLQSYAPQATAIVYYFVFSLGVLATLHTLHFGTKDTCFLVWERIFGDYVPLLQVHLATLGELSAPDREVLRAAYNIEESVTLGMLPDFMHDHVQQLMKSMFYGVFPAIV